MSDSNPILGKASQDAQPAEGTPKPPQTGPSSIFSWNSNPAPLGASSTTQSQPVATTSIFAPQTTGLFGTTSTNIFGTSSVFAQPPKPQAAPTKIPSVLPTPPTAQAFTLGSQGAAANPQPPATASGFFGSNVSGSGFLTTPSPDGLLSTLAGKEDSKFGKIQQTAKPDLKPSAEATPVPQLATSDFFPTHKPSNIFSGLPTGSSTQQTRGMFGASFPDVGAKERSGTPDIAAKPATQPATTGLSWGVPPTPKPEAQQEDPTAAFKSKHLPWEGTSSIFGPAPSKPITSGFGSGFSSTPTPLTQNPFSNLGPKPTPPVAGQTSESTQLLSQPTAAGARKQTLGPKPSPATMHGLYVLTSPEPEVDKPSDAPDTRPFSLDTSAVFRYPEDWPAMLLFFSAANPQGLKSLFEKNPALLDPAGLQTIFETKVEVEESILKRIKKPDPLKLPVPTQEFLPKGMLSNRLLFEAGLRVFHHTHEKIFTAKPETIVKVTAPNSQMIGVFEALYRVDRIFRLWAESYFYPKPRLMCAPATRKQVFRGGELHPVTKRPLDAEPASFTPYQLEDEFLQKLKCTGYLKLQHQDPPIPKTVFLVMHLGFGKINVSVQLCRTQVTLQQVLNDIRVELDEVFSTHNQQMQFAHKSVLAGCTPWGELIDSDDEQEEQPEPEAIDQVVEESGFAITESYQWGELGIEQNQLQTSDIKEISSGPLQESVGTESGFTLLNATEFQTLIEGEPFKQILSKNWGISTKSLNSKKLLGAWSSQLPTDHVQIHDATEESLYDLNKTPKDTVLYEVIPVQKANPTEVSIQIVLKGSSSFLNCLDSDYSRVFVAPDDVSLHLLMIAVALDIYATLGRETCKKIGQLSFYGFYTLLCSQVDQLSKLFVPSGVHLENTLSTFVNPIQDTRRQSEGLDQMVTLMLDAPKLKAWYAKQSFKTIEVKSLVTFSKSLNYSWSCFDQTQIHAKQVQVLIPHLKVVQETVEVKDSKSKPPNERFITITKNIYSEVPLTKSPLILNGISQLLLSLPENNKIAIPMSAWPREVTFQASGQPVPFRLQALWDPQNRCGLALHRLSRDTVAQPPSGPGAASTTTRQKEFELGFDSTGTTQHRPVRPTDDRWLTGTWTLGLYARVDTRPAAGVTVELHVEDGLPANKMVGGFGGLSMFN